MSLAPLERAIALLEQSKRSEAQKLLKQLITEDQHNLDAWFWLVETCPTYLQRLHVLEMCLEYNPDNEQVQQALEKLKRLTPAQLSATLPKYENKRSLKKREWISWETIPIVVLVSVGVDVWLLTTLLEKSHYYAGHVIIAMILAWPLSIIGALVGKLFSSTWKGSLLGAAIINMLAGWWFYTIALGLSLD